MIDSVSSHFELGHPRILVIGDAMLDRYTWGTAERVSPEAPVLVLRSDDREVRLGGAASVANLLRGMGCDASLASVVGDDHDGRTICRLLNDSKVNADLVNIDPSRPSTVKERFLGRSDHRQPHQILRVDTESHHPLEPDMTARLLEQLLPQIPGHDAVLISDYAKGVCTEQLMAEVIARCRKERVPVLVDPGHGVDFSVYRGATLIKPNRLEAQLAVGHPIRTPAEALKAAEILRERFQLEVVVVTLDRDGLVYVTPDEAAHLPIIPRAICDITGAGDTVLAALGLGLTAPHAQLPFKEIASLANVAAGIQVSQAGVTTISRDELIRVWQFEISRNTSNRVDDAREIISANSRKIISVETAYLLARQYHKSGRSIVFTNGCFDLLHVGHITMLEQAAHHGDVLFVAINSDESVKRLKGRDRPITGEQDRARMIAALGCVTHVMTFDDDTPLRLLENIRPDVLVKGGTTGHIVGREVVEANSGRVVRLGETPNQSTTSLINRVITSKPMRAEESQRCK